MNIIKISTLLIFLLLASCEKDDNSEAIEALAGHWHVLSFEPDNSSDISLMAKDVISILEQRGCDPIEFSFKSDGIVSYTNRMALLSATTGQEGTEVDCLWEGGLRKGTFDFDYENLILNLDDETILLDAVLEDEYITVQTDNMILNGQTVSGKLIFKRETGS